MVVMVSFNCMVTIKKKKFKKHISFDLQLEFFFFCQILNVASDFYFVVACCTFCLLGQSIYLLYFMIAE
jgi:hypothetical protein